MRAYQNSLLDPTQVTICMIDFEPQMFFGVESTPRNMVLNAATGLARTAQAFKIPIILSTVEGTNRKKLLLAGLWTEVCVALPALSAIEDGYEVYVVADACAGSTCEAHDMALQRIIQAGAKPVTWQAALLEMQRDWANKDTYQAVTAIIKEYGGAYGLGLEYAQAMVPAAQQH